jgi:hypothetical protein
LYKEPEISLTQLSQVMGTANSVCVTSVQTHVIQIMRAPHLERGCDCHNG